MASTDASTTEKLVAQLQRIEVEKRSLIAKMNELEMESKEHNLVLDVLEKAEPTRRCCRMVGGVLVPRTVQEVKPTLEANRAKISETLEGFNKTLEQLINQRNEIATKLGPLLKGVTPSALNAEATESEATDSRGKGSTTKGGGGGGVLV